MDEFLVLGAVFLLSLVFLTITFGDRLNLFGLSDGRWLSAPVDLAVWFWGLVCEAADRVWCFVFDHFWWVAATASGGFGVVLIALMLVTGLTEKAEADRQGVSLLARAGSVLDHVPIVDADRVVQISGVKDPGQPDHLLYQVPSPRHRFPVPAGVRRRITDFGSPRPLPEATDVPPLESHFPGRIRTPDLTTSRLTLTLEPFVERQGRRVRSADVDQLVRNSLFTLRRDDWQTFSQVSSFRQQQDSAAPLAEDPRFLVDDLESRIRVIPGDSVVASDIRVEKSAPGDAGRGRFEVEIRVRNQSRHQVDGLVVRELLPQAWKPVSTEPRAVYRDDVVTWLVDDLRPDDEIRLRMELMSNEEGLFQSYTEVSATAAVTAVAPVLSRRPTQPEQPLPPVERMPDVQLTLIKPPQVAAVGENVDVFFLIRNRGNAPASGVSLHVSLPDDLDHHDLPPNARKRFVDAQIRELAVGERRQVRLTVMPQRAGIHFATAELRLRDVRLDVRDFEITARRD